MDDKDGKGIIPLSRLANSVDSSLFEGNDRDLTYDRKISAGKNTEDVNSDKSKKLCRKRLALFRFGRGRSDQPRRYAGTYEADDAEPYLL